MGESGSGKEMLARYLHERSGRSGPFVALNCAALPEGLVESQLFGHQRGAFTGADRQHLGAFQQAHGGTLLLDEVGELPLSIQAKLLRALEESVVTPLGSTQTIHVDLRVVVAGHHSLQALVAAKRFRGDLFARLNGIELKVPPLRARREEVVELFLSSFERFSDGRRPALRPELAEALLMYDWPYNAREVVQMAHRMAAIHGERMVLGMDEAPAELAQPDLSGGDAVHTGALEVTPESFRELHRHEQLRHLRQALSRHGGNVSRAAQALGISRGRAYRLLSANKAGEQSAN
jgi:two-component system response regulator HydG